MEESPALLRDRTRSAEQHVGWVRFVLILFNIVIYYTVFDRADSIPWLAATVSVVAGLYGAVVVFLRPQDRFDVMESSIWTTTTDAALIVLWILATGAASSPFFVLWTISLVAIGYRYGPKATAQATGVYVLLETGFLVQGGVFLTAAGLVRLGYIVFVGSLMAFTSRFTILGMTKQQKLAELVDELEVAKQQLQETGNRLQAILHNAPSIILEVDLDGKISYVNRLSEGFTKEQVIGQSAALFIEEGSRAVFNQALQRVYKGEGPQNIEVRGYGDGMTIRMYRTHMGPIQDAHGNVRGAILITLDVTDEIEQKRLAVESERRQEEVARLEEEASFRNRFINTAAHELNTPLTPLRLQMGVLRGILGDSNPETRAVDIMERNLKRLGDLVTDLLDATKLQEGQVRLKITNVDIGALVDDAASTFESVADARGVTVEASVRPGTIAHGDAQRISQIVYNLLSNALKLTPSGGRVQCEAAATDAGHVELTVTDTGPGLTAEDRARLFQPFSQVHPSLVPEEPGTGLGLYLSRNLAEAQGGRLEVESEGRSKGATFRLILPTASKKDPGLEAS